MGGKRSFHARTEGQIMLSMALSDVPFGDEDAWHNFLFEHAMEHKQFASAIQSAYSVQVDAVVFADEGDLQTWLQENSNAHNQELSAIGIDGYVPADVDLTDQQAYNDWMAQHAMLHDMTRQALGL